MLLEAVLIMEKEVKKESKKEELKDKVSDVIDNIVEKVGEEDNSSTKVEPLVSCRVLFISALDKIYFVCFVISYIASIWGYVSNSLYYFQYGSEFFPTLWSLIGGFIGITVGFAVLYFILNWLYKCIAKTMICLTENEIYGEFYAPFYRGELSIPIEKITKVDTVRLFWVFRTLIIHRYHQIPIVFPTWKAQAFKDTWTNLVMSREGKIENEFESRNIFPEWLKKKFIIVIIFLASVFGIILIAYTVKYFDNPFKKIPGTYVYGDQKIILNKDNTCDLKNVIDDEVIKCTWKHDNSSYGSIDIDVDYTYRYKSSWSNKYYEYDRMMSLHFDPEDETLDHNWDTFRKEK